MALHEHHIDLRRITAAVGLLAAIVEGSADAIIAKDLDGTIISWNPAAERMFGYSEREAVGQHVDLLIPEQHRGEDLVVMERILAGASVEHYETERMARDGRLIEVSLTVSPLRDVQGRVVGASKIMRDISVDREARRVQQRLAAIVASSDDAIITEDRAGTITSWNPAAERIFGYEPEAAIGGHVGMLIPDDLTGQERDTLSLVLAGQTVDHYRTVRLARDGRRVDVSLSVSPLRDPDGTIVGAVKIVRDVSAQRRIEEQERRAAELVIRNEELAAADRLKDQFIAVANHELRTPLTSIAGFTQTLLDLEEQIEPERRREFLQIVVDQTSRLARLVDDMLVLGRLEAGATRPRPVEVDVYDGLARAVREFGRDEVRVDRNGDGPVSAFVDPDHFQQMLRNYLDNAVKYGAQDVVVTAHAVGAGGTEVVVRVSDDGPGVAADVEGRLFDRFTRAERDVASGTPGTGLGLAIVRDLARAHGGDAWYERNEPSGASFCLRLPAATD